MTTPASHPDPPQRCPLFRHCPSSGWTFSTESRWDGGRVVYLHDTTESERYYVALAAIDWLSMQRDQSNFANDRINLDMKIRAWVEYKNAARAEMEASNG